MDAIKHANEIEFWAPSEDAGPRSRAVRKAAACLRESHNTRLECLDELRSILGWMDNLAELSGGGSVLRRCRDRLQNIIAKLEGDHDKPAS